MKSADFPPLVFSGIHYYLKLETLCVMCFQGDIVMQMEVMQESKVPRCFISCVPLLFRLVAPRGVLCLAGGEAQRQNVCFGVKFSFGCGLKLNRRVKPQLLVHVSTYQGNPFWHRVFEPQPFRFGAVRVTSRFSKWWFAPWTHGNLPAPSPKNSMLIKKTFFKGHLCMCVVWVALFFISPSRGKQGKLPCLGSPFDTPTSPGARLPMRQLYALRYAGMISCVFLMLGMG